MAYRIPGVHPKVSPTRGFGRAPETGVHSRFTPQTSSPTVVLADGDDAERERVAACMASSGYAVYAFKTGRDAFEAAVLGACDLIITDLWLSGMDGFELIDALRKSGVTAPAIVHTAYITRSMVEELLQWRICRIFLKPLKLHHLQSFLRQTAKTR